MQKKSANPTDPHVGARIRLQRMVRGFSQELGRAVGVTFQQMQKYEKAVNRVSASRLQRIANVLKVAPDFFFDGASAKAVNSGRHRRPHAPPKRAGSRSCGVAGFGSRRFSARELIG
jgi:transcriptional regulator with XRE-family HTH domain